MEIKPTGPGGPLPPVSNDGQGVKKFAKAAQPDAAGGVDTGQTLQGIASDFRKADLQDPAKVDQMLSRCSSELLRSALTGIGGKVSPADSANLTGFLQNDPVIRGKLLNYLGRALT
jgi:hypothetical protein